MPRIEPKNSTISGQPILPPEPQPPHDFMMRAECYHNLQCDNYDQSDVTVTEYLQAKNISPCKLPDNGKNLIFLGAEFSHTYTVKAYTMIKSLVQKVTLLKS